jgi:uncharacterized protein YndB with AHSA1/START domain
MPAKHVYELYVRTTPDEVWAALTDPDRTERYWRGLRLESTWEPGAPVKWVKNGTASIHGEVVESDPPRKLVTTWNREFDDGVTEGPSRVTWEIEPMGAVSRLRLVHDDFHGPSRMYDMAATSWPIVLSSLKTMLESDDVLAVPDTALAPPAPPVDIDAIDHREWGRKSNNRVWELLGDGRPAADTHAELVDAAHASLWHWSYGGGALERERGEWMLSHVYAVVGDGAVALRHAQRCWDLTESQPAGVKDFDAAYACEAFARAYKVSGDTAHATEWFERATKAGAQIANDEDRRIFEGDLNG